MSGIGGGLHDHNPDPEPDRPPDLIPRPKIKASQREWLFWMAMVLGFWVAFQGSFPTAFWFLIMIITALVTLFFCVQTKIQIREIKKKGFWR